MAFNQKNIPKLSFSQTVRYCDLFTKNFFTLLAKEYQLIEITLPLVTNFNSVINADYLQRKINFDNNLDYEIYELIASYDSLLRYNFFYFDLKENEILYSHLRTINRDHKNFNVTFWDTRFFAFEIALKEENRNLKTGFEWIEKFWEIIKKASSSLEFTDKNVFQFLLKKNALSKIKKFHPFAKYDNIFLNYVREKKLVMISSNSENFLTFFKHKSITGYDFNCTIALFAWCEQVNTFVELMDFTFRPNWTILNEQIKNQKFDTNNDFFNLIQDDQSKVSISIKVFIDQLLFFLTRSQLPTDLPTYRNSYSIKDDYRFYQLKKNK